MQQLFSVCHLLSSLKVGGAERFVIDLSLEQQKMGHKVTIISFGSTEDELYQVAKSSKINVIIISKKWHSQNKSTLSVLKGFDIVHLHSPVILKAILLTLPFLSKQRIVYTRHGEGRYDNIVWTTLHHIARPFISAITFVSGNGQAVFNEVFGWQNKPQEVIENGIAIDSELSSPSRQHDKLRLGSVGGMVPLKGQADLVSAWARLPDAVKKQCEVHFIGDGESRASLEQLVVNFNAKNSIYFHGFLTKREDILNLFDILVVSSESEGLSIAILEAMANKKPVIATKVGGNPRLVIHNNTGMLYDFNDVSSLSKLICNYNSDRVLIDKHGINAYHYVEKNYSLTSSAKKYDLLYKV